MVVRPVLLWSGLCLVFRSLSVTVLQLLFLSFHFEFILFPALLQSALALRPAPPRRRPPLGPPRRPPRFSLAPCRRRRRGSRTRVSAYGTARITPVRVPNA